MKFLRAQAVRTWLAMNEQDCTCFMLAFDGTDEGPGPAFCHSSPHEYAGSLLPRMTGRHEPTDE